MKLKSLPSLKIKTESPSSPSKVSTGPGSPLKRKTSLKQGKTGTNQYFGGTEQAVDAANKDFMKMGALIGVCTNMDLKTKVTALCDIGMTDPHADFNQTIAKTLTMVRKLEFDKEFYPEETMEYSKKYNKAPKCIFIPDRELVRNIIMSMIMKRDDEREGEFLLKFGLIDPESYDLPNSMTEQMN